MANTLTEYIFFIKKSSFDDDTRGVTFFCCVQGQPGISGPPGLKGVAVSFTSPTFTSF